MPTKILLVEDSKFLRLTMERAMSRAGYAVSTAADGEQAIQMALVGHPDLILLDMLLPKIPGQEVLRILKKDAATVDIPVVVLSGLSAVNADRLAKDGAFWFLEKSELKLEKGTQILLATLSKILSQLPKAESGTLVCEGKNLLFSDRP